MATDLACAAASMFCLACVPILSIRLLFRKFPAPLQVRKADQNFMRSYTRQGTYVDALHAGKKVGFFFAFFDVHVRVRPGEKILQAAEPCNCFGPRRRAVLRILQRWNCFVTGAEVRWRHRPNHFLSLKVWQSLFFASVRVPPQGLFDPGGY